MDQSERTLGTADQSESAVVTWANNSSSCMYRARQSGVTQLRRGPAPSPVCTLGTNYTHIFSFCNSFLKLLDIPLAFIAENQDSDSELTTQHPQVRINHPDPAQATCQSSGPV